MIGKHKNIINLLGVCTQDGERVTHVCVSSGAQRADVNPHLCPQGLCMCSWSTPQRGTCGITSVLAGQPGWSTGAPPGQVLWPVWRSWSWFLLLTRWPEEWLTWHPRRSARTADSAVPAHFASTMHVGTFSGWLKQRPKLYFFVSLLFAVYPQRPGSQERAGHRR